MTDRVRFTASGSVDWMDQARIGDIAGPSIGDPQWVCVESGTPGRWERIDTPEAKALVEKLWGSWAGDPS